MRRAEGRGTLCDTGPLVALVLRDDPDRARCLAALPDLPDPLLTTWPCMTEAMHFAHRRAGWPAQALLWEFVEAGRLVVHEPSPGEARRMRELMERYRDLPMDLADASLVAAAEILGLRRAFTLDGHFHAYRIGGTAPFDVVP